MTVKAASTPNILHDFHWLNAAGQFWNGSAYVAWNSANYLTYRMPATAPGPPEIFEATPVALAVSWQLRERGASLALSYLVNAGAVATTEEIATNAATAATQAAAAALDASRIQRLANPITAGAPARRTAIQATSTTLDELYGPIP